jgi:hypothetical protein
MASTTSRLSWVWLGASQDSQARRGADPDIGPGRRDDDGLDAGEGCAVADGLAVGCGVAEGVAVTKAGDAGLCVVDVAEAGGTGGVDGVGKCGRLSLGAGGFVESGGRHEGVGCGLAGPKESLKIRP